MNANSFSLSNLGGEQERKAKRRGTALREDVTRSSVTWSNVTKWHNEEAPRGWHQARMDKQKIEKKITVRCCG